MNYFINYIDSIYPLTEEAKAELNSRVDFEVFEKGQEIISANKVCNKLYFLKQGLVKGYFINANGTETIFRFFSEGSVFTSFESYVNQKATPHAIRALEHSEVYHIPKYALDELSKKYQPLEDFYQSVLKLATSNMVKRFSELITKDATERYQQFVTEDSGLIQRISLGDLACYLGITQVSLSRIRKVR